ncbi:S-adenosyl-L-methionine-dependent methyltransferase [Coemansia spiralis]|nr:S-adenosyl-L-methionine-dependent methyltransferase [Coemansia spiralis]
MSVLSYSESGWDTQDERWDDWEGDEMNTPMKCLFCTQTFQSAIVLFRHVKQTHGFDFPKARAALKLDFYQGMRVVNYIRSMELSDPNFANGSEFALDGSEAFLSDDKYLRPTIPEDALLYALDELDLDDTASQQLGLREREVKFVSEQFEEYRQMVKRQFFDTIEDTSAENADDTESSCNKARGEPGNSDYYFNSYAGNDIHMQMLQDKVRTEGYRDFMYDNKDIFKDKVVLDVGCGTGILSMFAARAGAKKVIAVDNSDIIHKAHANIVENKLDTVITLIKGKIEDLELPVDSVDIIISEWMGYFLLFEAMLDSVLVARDRYLAPGGLLAPSASYIYLTAISDEDYMNDQVNYWDNVYGFKMSAMKPSGPVLEADVDVIPAASVMATRALIAEIDHGTTSSSALDFSSPFALKATRKATVHAFLGYFDVAFSRAQSTPGPSNVNLCLPAYSDDAHTPAASRQAAAKALWKQPESAMHGFTTGPHGTPTHWKQTVFVLREPVDMEPGDEIYGTFTCTKSTENPRELELAISYCYVAAADANGDRGIRDQNMKHQVYQLR